jgi:ribosomal protein L37AE/L43A
MKERNLIPNDSKIRERKSCPYCASLNIAKYRKLRGFYRCRACHSLFPKPELKKVKTYKGIPLKLKEIMEMKERRYATEVQ